MSLLTSMSSGTSGLASASAELSVVGDNIANANTIGFKSGRVAFEDALAQNVVGGLGQMGLGSRVEAIQRIITQGALTTTGVSTDLALQGAGLFQVKGTASDGRTGTFYTRAGQFTVDNAGYLVNLDGLRVQGYAANLAGAIQPVASDLLVGTASSQPQASGVVTIKANLNSSSSVPAVWDAANPSGTSNFSTSVTVYDTLGKGYQVQVYFRNNGPDGAGNGTWEWHAMTDSANFTPAGTGQVSIADGTLTFDPQGRLTAQTQTSNFAPIALTNQPLTFNVGTPYVPGSTTATGLDGITQFASTSASTFVGQDGWASGTLTGFQIDTTGVIQGIFTNGQQRALGQVAVATPPAADKMERAGDNLYVETRASGSPVLGTAGAGGRGYITSGALEQSNVDVAEQFVRMISAQRSYEANSKTISTADQLLSELIAMKR